MASASSAKARADREAVQEACRLYRQGQASLRQALDAINGKPVVVRGPAFFAYIRVSTDEQIDGASLDVQKQQAEAKYEKLKLERPELEWGGVFNDEGQSAYRVRFLNRPEGGRLDENLRSGDVICVYRLDRSFRSTEDFLQTFKMWHERGVRLTSSAEEFDIRGPWGKFIATTLVAVAELDSSIKSERIKDSLRMQRSKGGLTPGKYPAIGYMRVTAHGRRYQIPDPKQLVAVRRIVELKDQGLSYWAVSDRIEAEQAQAEGRPVKPNYARKGVRRRWDAKSCERAYKRRDELLAELAKIEAQDAEEERLRAESE